MYSILYVDDEPGLLEIAKIFLEQDKGFSVDIDTSAEHALGPIGTRSYDAIVSDYQMPGMDGIGFLKAVRERYGDIPFILFTGRGREEVVIQAINNGADFYLQKGGDPRAQFAELAHKVRQAVARKRAEYSLVESEKRLTDIINFLPDATFAIDRAGTVIAWNRAIEEMTGVPAREMLGKGDYEYAVPFYGTRRKILIDLIFEPDEVVAKNYANIHREKDVLIADTNLPRPLGKVVRLAGKASPLYDRLGRIVGAIESIRDVTQHERDAEQIAQKTSALSIINRIIQASNLPQTIGEYAKNVISLTIDLLKYHGGGVYLVDDDRKIARIISSENLPPAFIAAVDNIDIHTAPYDALFIRGEPVIIENLETALPQAAAVSGFHAVASIPIVTQGRVVGALNVANRESSLVSQEDREILISIGKEFGSAISRIKAESSLRDSEGRFRQLADATLEGIVIHRDGRIVDLNDSACSLFGYSREEMIGKDLLALAAPGSVDDIWTKIAERYDAPYEARGLRKDGSVFWAELRSRNFSPGGEILRITTLWDITARKDAEVAVRESQERLRSFMDSATDAFTIWDKALNLIDLNNVALSYLPPGTRKEDVIGKNYEDLMPGARGREDHDRYLGVIRTGVPYAGSEELPGTGYGKHWLAIKAFRVGEGLGIVTSDITREKVAEEELRAAYEQLTASEEELRSNLEEVVTAQREKELSEKNFQSLVDQAPYAIYIQVNNRFVYVNNAAIRLLGAQSADDLLGTNPWDRIHPDYHAIVKERVRNVTGDGSNPGTLDEVFLKLDGTPVDVAVTGVPFVYRGATGVLVILNDISGRKRSERELRSAYEQIAASEEELRSQYEELAFAQQKIRESEQQLLEITATIPGVVYQFFARADGGMGVYFVSSRANEVFGIENDPERYFDTFTGNVDPRDEDRFLDSIRTSIVNGAPWDFEGRYQKPDGERIWFQGIARPVKKGSEVIYNGILLDITARKRAEEERRISEEKYRHVIEHSPYGMHFYDLVPGRGLVFTGANPAADRILKVAHDRFIGKTIEEAFPGLKGTEVPGAYLRVAESGSLWQTEQVVYSEGDLSRAYTVTAFRIAPGSVVATFVDITERKRAENELLLLKISVDRAYDEVFWMDFTGKILYVNDAACQVTGYSREELLAMKIFELDPDFPPEVWDRSVADLREHKKQFITTRHRCRDGRIIDVEIAATYVNKDGREYSFAFVRDITGRKRMEDALFSSRQMLTSVLDAIPQRVFWKDRNSVFLGCNRQNALDAGYSEPAGMVGKTDFDYATPEIAERYRADDRSVMESGKERINYEEPQVRQDGSRAWLRTSKIPLRNQAGEIVGVLGTYEDITEQKMAQEKLRESEERYRSLVESSFDGIAIHQDGVIVYVNSTAARLLGYGDTSSLIGKPALDIVHPDERARVAARMAESPEKPLELVHERFLRADGGSIQTDVATTPCMWQGRPAVYVTFRDITERVAAEEALEKRLVALTRPLEDGNIAFEFDDLFDTGELQRLQDEFAKATGVAVLLTRPDGTPITTPSNFCRLCSGIVRSTQKGRERCYKSDSELGGFHGSAGPYIHTCLSAGLWGAGANIVVGDRHIANWLIGQVRNETQTEDDMRNYAREIGVDEEEFIRAFLEVPVMSTGKFAAVAQALSTLANLLSRLAFQNVQQARFITERERAEEALRQKTEELDQYFNASLDLFCIADTGGYFRRLNPEWEKTLGYTLAELEGKRFLDFVHPDDLPPTLEAVSRLSDQKEVLNFTNRYRHKDGSYRWIEWRSFPSGDQIFAAARDITGRKRMEEALRESEERYRSLFENSYAVMLLIDPETGAIIDANPAACAYYGWSHDEFLTRRIDEINTLSPEQIHAEMTAARTQKRSQFLFRHRRADGSERDVEVYSGPLRIKGRLLLYSIVIDVTERRRMEEELRATEERLRLFIQQAPVALAMFDTGMLYLAASRRWIADYHLGNRDILGRSHYEVFPEIPEEMKEVHRRALAGEVVSASEEQFVREDGSVQWLAWEVRPWYTTGNTIGGIIIFSEDITRRKQAEEALRESEEKYRNLVENSLSIIYTMLPDGTFTFVSPSWKKFLGHEPSEVVGKNFRAFVHPDDIPMCEDFLNLIVESGGVQTNTGDYRIYHKDGSVHWNRSSVMPVFDAAGNFTLLVGNAIDVTTRKRAEDALLESRAELASILHGSPVLQFVIDREHRIVSWNKALEEYTGFSADEVVGTDQQWRPFYPEKRPVLADLLIDNKTEGLTELYGGSLKPSRYVEGAYEATGFFPKVGASGSWLSFTAAPVRNAEGEIIGAVETLEDITERKRMQDALLEKTRNLSERVKEIQCLYTVTRLTESNPSPDILLPAIANALPSGWQYPEQTCARVVIHGREFRSENFRTSAVKQESGITVNGEQAGTVEISFLGDGERQDTQPFLAEESDLLNAVADTISRAIERQQAEQALQESGEKYRRILENMQDAYFRVDENGIITMVNPSAARMYGYGSLDEMIGIPVASLYVDGEKQRSELILKLRESGGVTDFSGEGIRKDGTIFWVSLNAQYFTDREGRIRGTEGIVRDVTERRAMERAIREANRKLTLLGSITRHDVANKVAIITGFAQAARMHKLIPEVATYLTKIEAAGADISRQIAFTKTYQELGVNAPAWISIPDLVGRQRAEGIAITCTCHAEVYADPMLEKVFFNLVDNAVRHGEKVSEIAVRCTAGPDGLLITVADNGAGVPEELKEKIFERGFGKHTGFGLFLAREILAITGITIRETGTRGQGAKFEMVVPKGLYRGIESNK